MATFPSSLKVSILAFDFGTRKIGVAVGQSVTGTAQALPELPARDGQPDWQAVARLIEEWQPDAFVVGVPVQMDGTEFELTQRARKFGQRLHGRFGKPWFAMDERLTSFEAREQQREWRQAGSTQDSLVDSIAASLILQSWFTEEWPQLVKEMS
ncbi:Holliday junction resolvase RuvX [Ketobacter sp.]|uniref:Holliday junction resolvase RuvX n=1 Tax=Ketobacter sp. TaxID=2083498 RepID=UPI000F1F80C3|nr:Holliday junction resolvase RuvX [Ketobacter sp.]RLT95131.1 MAG: Holliday junction resolvase RuvX [Ketobacter sp.]